MAGRVVAIIVTYFPDLLRLIEVVRSVEPQVSQIVAFDNTPAGLSGDTWSTAELQNVTVMSEGVNLGLAVGLNRAIGDAIQRGASHLLLLDQDSVPFPGMVSQLQRGLDLALVSGLPVAAAGPVFLDSRGAVPPAFMVLGFPVNQPVHARPDQTHVLTDVLITSGTLLSVVAYERVGAMNEGLFIDNIDIEWGFRAKSRGWVLIGVPSAVLSHQLGDQHRPAPMWARCLGRRHIIQHAPDRLYYIMRNRLLLIRMSHIPLLWKLQDLLRIPWKFLISLSTASDPAKACKAMLQGLWHGLIGRSGARP